MTESKTSEGGGPAMVKPNCTITTRHKDLLRSLADDRYGTQSGALRVAIEKLHAEISDGGTVTEDILVELRQLNERIGTLESTFDGTPGDEPEGEPATSQEPLVNDEGITGAFNDTDASADPDIEMDVYDAIPVDTSLTVSEIAIRLDEDVAKVHQAIGYLLDRDLIITTGDSNSNYTINTTNND